MNRLQAIRLAAAIVALPIATVGGPIAAEPIAVHVDRAWFRTPISEVNATLAFMTVEASGSARILSARSEVARAIRLQYTAKTGETVLRQSVDEIPLVAGRALVMGLEPGSYHLMPIGLKKKLAPGDKVPLTIVVQRGTQRPMAFRTVATVRTPPGFHPFRDEDVH